ncbi:hypothetical protein GAZ38_09395 [Bacteroides xylanisolvens]|jgi:hypothetical protein|uniref:DUF4355 domain-containing protein n=2 Tax=Bacteroides TaxID=816 RepID=A0A6N2TSN4_BACOV|nr:hypothetical protein [Bacteroides xylanisolvens]KAB3669241.1 hypothetical protein GAT05_11265 [Phocaeicola vulgatus]KAB3669665.1 hypothetical protein GAT02_10520 [Phocaeicola vulgatus]KAB6371558.1 hypothetical protein GAZ38_09395 [Bacteroides xylanisolvens]KAB6372825.1 hypothetical protein GAZ46_08365 [Bacteroides xylanisolvens]KAB6380343.1 hypothetical protein GAZ34_08435 [Bacteroides xylanisolvens]
MNKKLFEKVKGLCKDTGLSEKYLKAITEKMGGSIEDDSTDDEAIESTANLIAEVAKESQGEATRWANKNKETKTEEEKKAEEERKKKEEEERLKGKVALDEATEKRLKEMEEKIANYEAKESKEARAKEVVKAMEKHKIPAYLRDRLAKSISDDEDIEDAVSAYKQELITNGLDDEHSGGAKAASEKQIDEAADSLLESITVK